MAAKQSPNCKELSQPAQASIAETFNQTVNRLKTPLDAGIPSGIQGLCDLLRIGLVLKLLHRSVAIQVAPVELPTGGV